MATTQTNKWTGIAGPVSQSTPFGFYDDEAAFQTAAPKTAQYCAIRLGYPSTDIELIDKHFYAAFEESITEYSAQVNQFNIRSNLDLVVGAPTGSNLTHTNIQGAGIAQTVRLAQDYGAEVGAGGQVDWKKGYVETVASQQVYDLDELWAYPNEASASIEIKRLFHHNLPAISRFFDPWALTGLGTLNLIEQFGFQGFTPTSHFILQPLYADLLRIQAIELNDQIRKSQFSFELINNKLRIHPIPKSTFKLYFDYIVMGDRDSQIIDQATPNVISDYSNIPYNNMTYSSINDTGAQWIRKYTLAVSKEMLGNIRQKFQSIPIPDSEVTMNGAELTAEAQTEKDQLIEQLRENLEETSRATQMEKKAAMGENHQQQLNKIPLPIYVA